MSNESGQGDPMTSLTPWARALGLDPEGVTRVVVDVRMGALPVCLIETMPGSPAAWSLVELTRRLDQPAVLRPLDEAERESVEAILADMGDDAQSLAMSGDKGRAEYAEHYARRLRRVLGESP